MWRGLFASLCALLLLAATAQASDLGRGSFAGKSGHTASGHVSVVETDKGTVVRLEEDFRFDGAPDPKLGFGKGGYAKESKFGPLERNSGQQEYLLPSRIDPEKYDEVWIWCEKYNVPLGVAEIQR